MHGLNEWEGVQIGSFRYVNTKYGNLVFDGGPETGEALTWIESLGFTSPRQTEKESRREQNDPNADWIRIYFADRGYGFTHQDVYFHVDDVISGTPRDGARIEYTTRETPRGLRAKNVYILN